MPTIDMSSCPCCGITNACCGSTAVPTTIHGTVSGGAGGSAALAWDGVSKWTGTITLTGNGTGTLGISLYCDGGATWRADFTGCATGTNVLLTGTCSPLSIATAGFLLNFACYIGAPANVVLTVTV